ncbi:MAG TPA: RNA-splicing ligase RtcB, partial [Clostridiales bacterium]|nr:RNA-splicing ligase RtcB [Clostridiales bacterium]
IMPDTHAGAGCTIGTTMTVRDQVVPNMVGVDIGCGMETVVLSGHNMNLDQFDRLVHAAIPSGFAVRDRIHPFYKQIDLDKLRCREAISLKRAELSIGTLGGGNHFIEIDHDDAGRFYLVVHSGSRNLGKQTAEYYQGQAARQLAGLGIEKQLAYCEGQLLQDYLHDMAIIQHYADLNRRAIMQELLNGFHLEVVDRWTTIHNYIDLKTMVLRKGAVSAKAGERLLIPVNMRDGSLIAIGKGNPDWNESAPHGAGRLMSRTQARRQISLSDYRESMKGIYSSTINASTLDEAAFAYKPLAEILDNIVDTVDIVQQIHPVYNFKAAE